MFFIHTPLFSKIAPIWCQPFIDFMAHPSGAFPGWLVATSVLQKLQQRSIETGLEISSWYVFFFKSCSFRKLEWWTTFLGNLCSSCDLYLTKFATKWQKMRCFLRHFSWQHFVEQLPRKAMSFLWIQCPMHVKHNGRHGVPKFCLLVWCWAGRGTID